MTVSEYTHNRITIKYFVHALICKKPKNENILNMDNQKQSFNFD